MARLNKDIVSGIVLSVFALALYLVIIPRQVEYGGTGPIALSPRLFCQITAVLLFALSLWLVVVGWRQSHATEASADPVGEARPLSRGAVSVAVSAVYVMAMEPLGYFSTTVVAMVFFLYFFGARSWKGITLYLGLMMPFIYVLFVKALKVILPNGVFF